MKRIGEIAARLVANPIELVAAANQSAAHELCPDDNRAERKARPGAQSNREEASAHLLAGGVAGSMGKDRGSVATPASPDLGGQKTRRDVKPRLQLVAVNDKIETSIGMRGIRPRGFPASLPRSPVLVIVDGCDHAALLSITGTSMRARNS